jgi:hypothetical protein
VGNATFLEETLERVVLAQVPGAVGDDLQRHCSEER